MRFLSALVVLAVGCGEATGPVGGNTQKQAIVGDWLSEGANVAPLLAGAPFNWTKITATFDSDGSYTVLGTDKADKQTTFAGTWIADPTDIGGIYDITINQATPATTTAEGIFQVSGTSMKYEVVQTQPTNGLLPPSAKEGFGSTIYNGKKIDTLIQTFVRQ
jgi:hypothetical protein